MAASIKRILLVLALFAAAGASPRTWAVAGTVTDDKPGATAEQPPADAAAPGRNRGGDLERATLFAMPGEEPIPPFVPLHPQTVEQRRRIDAITEYCAACAFEKENLWAEAIDLLEKALVLEPDSGSILKRLSHLCFSLGKVDQGQRYGRRALDQDPGDTEMITQLVAHYTKSDPAAAEALLNEVLANPRLETASPGYLVAELELGKLCWGKLQQVDRAADAFAKVVEALDEKTANRLSSADQKRLLGGDESTAAASYLDFGVVFLAAQRYELAIKAFRRGLVYDEDDPQLPLLLAQTLVKTGKGNEALRLVEDYLKRQPLGAEGYDLLAKILTALNRGAEITPRLEAAAKTDSKNILLQYILADRYRETGQTERAEQMYKALLSAEPSAQGYGALAASLFKRKRYDELLKVMSEALTKPGGGEAIKPHLDAIENDPRVYANEVLEAGLRMLEANPPRLDVKPALFLLSHIANRTEKFAQLVALKRLELKENANPMVYREIAEALVRDRKFGEAAATVEELLTKHPEEKNPALLVFLAQFRSAADQNDAALDAVREALKLDPTDSSAQRLMILLLSQMGKVDEAIEFGRKVLKDDPSDPQFNSLLGGIMSQFGRTDDAIALYKGLLERFANKPEVVKIARSGLSVAYVNLGEFAKGEAELEALLELDPDDPGVNNDLGYLYADRGRNLEKAEAMIRKAVQEEPDNPAYLDSLGWVLFKRGKAKDAVEPLEKAVKNLTGGGDATIHEHLGDVYIELQDVPKAKAAWEDAEKSAAKAIPTDRRLPEIRKKLQSLDRLGSTPKPNASDTP